MKTILSLFVLFLSTISLAHNSEVIWLKLGRGFAYQDIQYACESIGAKSDFDLVYLVTEMVDGKINRAIFRTQPNDKYVVTKKIEFTAAELSGLEFFEDSESNVWLKSMHLSERLLRWIFTHSRDTGFGCFVPESTKLLSLSPQESKFDFIFTEPKNIFEKGISNKVIYRGSNEGGSYKASLYFVQKQF